MIPFAKVHACGNDFLIVESQHVEALFLPGLTQRLCARTTGVGADGVEYLRWMSATSVRIHLHNADGSVAEISGNGTRCVAAYMAHRNGTGRGNIFTIETDVGRRECRILQINGNRYTMASAMGVPSVSAHTVVLQNGKRAAGAVVSMGNPHFVLFVEDTSFEVLGRSWQEVGCEICHHPDFPQQTNVEFVRVVSAGEIEIRIFERGVGPTSSSGTGTCAAAAATIMLRNGDRRMIVGAPGGVQQIDWPVKEAETAGAEAETAGAETAGAEARGTEAGGTETGDAEIMLTGPAEIICFGEAFPMRKTGC